MQGTPATYTLEEPDEPTEPTDPYEEEKNNVLLAAVLGTVQLILVHHQLRVEILQLPHKKKT